MNYTQEQQALYKLYNVSNAKELNEFIDKELINLGITDVFSDDYKNLNLDDKTLNLIEYKKQNYFGTVKLPLNEAIEKLDYYINNLSEKEINESYTKFISNYGKDNLPDYLNPNKPAPKRQKIGYYEDGTPLYYDSLDNKQKERYQRILAQRGATTVTTLKEKGIRDYIPDELEKISGNLVEEVVSGTLDFGGFVYDSALGLVDWATSPIGGGTKLKEKIGTGERYDEFVDVAGATLGGRLAGYENMQVVMQDDGTLIYTTKEPKTTAGQLTVGVGEFVANYIIGKKGFTKLVDKKSQKKVDDFIKKYGTYTAGTSTAVNIANRARTIMVRSAPTYAKAQYALQVSLDPEEGRFAYALGEWLSERSDLAQEFFDYLDLTDPAELSEAENRLGLLVEDLFLVGGLAGFFATAKGTYNISRDSIIAAMQKLRNLTPEAKKQFKATVENSASKNSKNSKSKIDKKTVEDTRKSLMLSSNRIIRAFQKIGKNFKSEGYLNAELFNIIKSSDKAKIAWASRAENLATNLEAQLKKLVDKKYFKNADEAQRFIEDILTAKNNVTKTKLYKNLPKEVKTQLKEIRQTIDDLSSQLRQQKGVPSDLKTEIGKNIGKYLRQSYRRFEDVNYKPSQEIIDDAVNYLVKKNKGTHGYKSLSDDALRNRMELQIKNLLDGAKGKDYKQFLDDMFKNQKVRNLNIVYKNRKQFAEPIQKLLGKEDATTRIFRTVANLSNDLFNAKLYDDLYKAGNNKIFFTPKQAEKFAASAKTQRQKNDFFRFQSATIEGAEFGALNGLKTTPEIARLFNTVNKNSFRKGAEQVYSMFLMAKGYGQAAATVGNLYTHLRNTYGQGTIMLSNGMNPFSAETRNAFKILQDRLTKGGDKELQKIYAEFLELGIVNQNVKVGDFKRLINNQATLKVGDDFFKDSSIIKNKDKNILKASKDKAQDIFDKTTDLYVAEDDLFRIAAFDKELKVLQQAEKLKPINTQKTLAELKQEAADIVRNTFPTYELVPFGAQRLRTLPFGNFYSFHAERFRNTIETYKRGWYEINSNNKVLMQRGFDRLAGKITYGAFGTTAVSAASRNLLGVTEEDDRHYKNLYGKPWEKNSEWVYMTDNEGNLFYIDTQFTDPDAPVNNAIRGVLRELTDPNTPADSAFKRISDAVIEGGKEYFKPFVDEALFTERAIDILFQAEDSEIKNKIGIGETDDILDITWKKFKYAFETLIPQTIRQLYPFNKEGKLGNSIYRELTEENPVDKSGSPIDSGRELIVNATGLRFNPLTEVKAENALKFKLKGLDNRYKQYKNELHKLINDAKTDSSISLQDILNKHLEINSSYYRDYVEAIKAVEAAKYFDINPSTLGEIIKDNTSFKKENKTDLQFLTNNFHPIIIGEESYRTLRDEVMRSDEDKGAILDTIAANNWKFKQLPILDLENISEQDIKFFEELMEEKGIGETVSRSLTEKIRERRVTGGFISGPYVPQTKEDPADRINPFTGEPYQEQMDRLGFAEGGEKTEVYFNPEGDGYDYTLIEDRLIEDIKENPNFYEEKRNILNRNPTNIVKTNIGWNNELSDENNTDPTFEQFETLYDGTRAGALNIHSKFIKPQEVLGGRRAVSISDMVDVLSPAKGDLKEFAHMDKENPNNPNFKDYIAHRMGVGVNDELNFEDPTIMKNFIIAVTGFEGDNYELDDELTSNAVQDAFNYRGIGID